MSIDWRHAVVLRPASVMQGITTQEPVRRPSWWSRALAFLRSLLRSDSATQGGSDA